MGSDNVIWVMRILAPTLALCCAYVAGLAYALGDPLLPFNILFLIINVALTYFEWFVFEPEKPAPLLLKQAGMLAGAIGTLGVILFICIEIR